MYLQKKLCKYVYLYLESIKQALKVLILDETIVC
jgi:hypothetical protein